MPTARDDALPEGMVEEAQAARERRAKALALWRQLRAGSLHPADTLTALRAIGKGRLIEAHEEVAAYLRADDSEERRAALMVLGLDFGLAEYAGTALDFLEHDPDPGCRLMGAAVLGALLADSKDATPLRALARLVRDEQEDAAIRAAAYSAMLALLDFNPRQQFDLATSRLSFPQDVDWELVERYLPERPDAE